MRKVNRLFAFAGSGHNEDMTRQISSFFAALVAALMLVGVGAATSDLQMIDPAELRQAKAKADRLFNNKDVEGLIDMLKASHLFVQADVAIKLGRLNAKSAIEELERLNQFYCRFACAESGEFRVALILIENEGDELEQKALLDVATAAAKQYPPSVIDRAGKELSRYSGAEIQERLESVQTYGAQFTALAHQFRNLSQDDAVRLCIRILERHETPLKAQAAEDLLISFGRRSTAPVRQLKSRIAAQAQPTKARFTPQNTVLSRCDDILRQISNRHD